MIVRSWSRARARVSPGGRAAEGGGGGGGSQPKDRHLESTRRPTRGGGEREGKTREAKAVRAASEYATHAEILRARADAERREIEIEMALEEKERLARVAREEREGEEALRGLDAFEKNLSRNAAGRKASDESSGTSGLGIPGGSRRDPREHLAAMRARPSLTRARCSGRASGPSGASSPTGPKRRSRARRSERRRRKLDAERERAGAAAEARRREDELLATLAVKSKQETRVAERLSALERERDVMRDNRRDRDARPRGAAARGLGGGAAPRGEDGSAAARGLPRGRGSSCGGRHRRRALRERARAPRGCPAVRGGARCAISSRWRAARAEWWRATEKLVSRGASTASGPGCWWRASRSPSRCPRARRRWRSAPRPSPGGARVVTSAGRSERAGLPARRAPTRRAPRRLAADAADGGLGREFRRRRRRGRRRGRTRGSPRKNPRTRPTARPTPPRKEPRKTTRRTKVGRRTRRRVDERRGAGQPNVGQRHLRRDGGDAPGRVAGAGCAAGRRVRRAARDRGTTLLLEHGREEARGVAGARPDRPDARSAAPSPFAGLARDHGPPRPRAPRRGGAQKRRRRAPPPRRPHAPETS